MGRVVVLSVRGPISFMKTCLSITLLYTVALFFFLLLLFISFTYSCVELVYKCPLHSRKDISDSIKEIKVHLWPC